MNHSTASPSETQDEQAMRIRDEMRDKFPGYANEDFDDALREWEEMKVFDKMFKDSKSIGNNLRQAAQKVKRLSNWVWGVQA